MTKGNETSAVHTVYSGGKVKKNNGPTHMKEKEKGLQEENARKTQGGLM